LHDLNQVGEGIGGTHSSSAIARVCASQRGVGLVVLTLMQ
jgi:hypothetical protein